MKKKINLQLIGISVLAIVITVLVMFTIFYDVYQQQVKDDLETVAETLKDTHIFQEDNQTGYYFDTENLRVTWIGTDGKVLYDNSADENSMENHAARPEVQDAFRFGSGQSVRESETLNRSTYYYALRLDDGSVLRVSRNEENVWSIARSMIPAVAVMLIFMIVLCIVLARILTRSIIGPIEEMAVNIDDYSIVPAYKELVPFVRQIRKQHTDILGAAKMRQDFTANVSHELKTPLTAISGYAELMENGMVGQNEVADFSAKIRQNVERLLSLINDTIRLSELDNGMTKDRTETFDLYELAKRSVENLKVYARKHDVTITCSGMPVCVTADREMIAELIDNLCNNAIRYNNKNGTVTVEIGTREGHAFLCVKDTGIGIPKEHQERVFERFYRVDKSRSKQTGGTGLGLAIVKHIVAIHNAALALESEIGKGTEITVTF